MVTSEQPMANWNGTVECAGYEKEEYHTQQRQNDELVMPFNCCSQCGHDRTSFFLCLLIGRLLGQTARFQALCRMVTLLSPPLDLGL